MQTRSTHIFRFNYTIDLRSIEIERLVKTLGNNNVEVVDYKTDEKNQCYIIVSCTDRDFQRVQKTILGLNGFQLMK